jgi:hypothetical protein
MALVAPFRQFLLELPAQNDIKQLRKCINPPIPKGSNVYFLGFTTGGTVVPGNIRVQFTGQGLEAATPHYGVGYNPGSAAPNTALGASLLLTPAAVKVWHPMPVPILAFAAGASGVKDMCLTVCEFDGTAAQFDAPIYLHFACYPGSPPQLHYDATQRAALRSSSISH